MKKYLAAAALALLLAAPIAEAAKPKVLGKAGGFTYVRDTEAVPVGPLGAVGANARCPKEMATAGGGASISGSPAESFLASSSRISERDWFVGGWRDDVGPATLDSYVVCTKKVDDVFPDTIDVLAAAGPAPVQSSTDCPDGSVISGGMELEGPATEWSLHATYPLDFADSDDIPEDEWRTFVFHRPGSVQRVITMQAICMLGEVPDYVVKDAVTDDPTQTLKSKCPSGSVVVGGGAFASGDAGDTHLVTSAPFDSNDKGKVPEDGWKTTYSNDDLEAQSFQAIAVCR